MNGLKWGMNNPNVKPLPFDDASQSTSEGSKSIKWQNGFDNRYAGGGETKVPTKEIIDEVISFLSQKQFFAKCGGIIKSPDPYQMFQDGKLPSINQGDTSDPTLWTYIYELFKLRYGMSFFENENGIGLKGKFSNFLIPDNFANSSEGERIQIMSFMILGTPQNGAVKQTVYPNDFGLIFGGYVFCPGLGLGLGLWGNEHSDYRFDNGNLSSIAHNQNFPYVENSPAPLIQNNPYLYKIYQHRFLPLPTKEFELEEVFDRGDGYTGNDRWFFIHKPYAETEIIPWITKGLVSELFSLNSNQVMSGTEKVEFQTSDPQSPHQYFHQGFRANTDLELFFDYQAFLNVTRYTDYGKKEHIEDEKWFCTSMYDLEITNIYIDTTVEELVITASFPTWVKENDIRTSDIFPYSIQGISDGSSFSIQSPVFEDNNWYVEYDNGTYYLTIDGSGDRIQMNETGTSGEYSCDITNIITGFTGYDSIVAYFRNTLRLPYFKNDDGTYVTGDISSPLTNYGRFGPHGKQHKSSPNAQFKTPPLLLHGNYVKSIAKYENGCIKLFPGNTHNLYMKIAGDIDKWINVDKTYVPPIKPEDNKGILIASGGNLVCDRIFVRRGSYFDFFLDSDCPVDFRFQCSAISVASQKRGGEVDDI